MRYAVSFAILCAIWGTTWMAIKVGLQDSSPMWFVTARFACAALGLTAFALVIRARWPKSLSEWKVNAALSLVMFVAPYSFVFWGMQHITSGQAAVLYATQPFFMALAAHYWLAGEAISGRRVLGMAAGFAGVSLIFWQELAQASNASVLGGLTVVGSALCGTAANLIAKGRLDKQHPVTATATQLWIGGLVMLPISLLLEPGFPVRITRGYLTSALYLGIVGTSFAFALFYWLLRRLKATTLSYISFVTPVVAVTVGALLLHETVRWSLIAGGALVLSGVLTAVSGPRLAPAPAEA